MTNGNDTINVVYDEPNVNDKNFGLTKREYFAAMAMQGILANHWCQNEFNGKITAIGEEQTATQSLSYADALIAELNKPTT